MHNSTDYLNYLMYKIMEFGVTSALALDNWEQKYCQTLGNEPNQSHRVLRGRLFSKGKLKLFNSLFHSVYLVLFQKFVFYCRFVRRALSVGRMQRREMFCGDKARGRHWRRLACWFGLFTIVYVSKYCLPIATLNPNKRIWATPK